LKPSSYYLAIAGMLLALNAQADNTKGSSFAGIFDDDSKPWTEAAYTLPAYPQLPDWVRFDAGPDTSNKYYADSKSLSIAGDGTIHLILRIQSASGVENLSVEGIQCDQGNYRSYAFGDSINKVWIESIRTEWRRIGYDDKARRTLIENLCPEKNVPTSNEQLAKLLQAIALH